MKVPPPGRLVGGLHVQVAGRGSPVVVLEAGIAASSVSWSLVQQRVAEFTTVLSYDRAGFGWSDPSSSSPTALAAAENLASLLRESGLSGPYVLAGHSFGGLIARLFQQHWPDQTAGLVLVDPVVRAEWRAPSAPALRRLRRGVTLSRRGGMLARFGVVGFALRLLTGGSRRVPQLLARVSAGKSAGVTGRLVREVRKMPRELWPAVAWHWSRAQSFEAMADNLENLPRSVNQLNESRSLDDLPVIVLSASTAVPEHLHDARLSTRGEHIVVPESGHWMQLDAPGAVVDAIGRVVAVVRDR